MNKSYLIYIFKTYIKINNKKYIKYIINKIIKIYNIIILLLSNNKQILNKIYTNLFVNINKLNFIRVQKSKKIIQIYLFNLIN